MDRILEIRWILQAAQNLALDSGRDELASDLQAMLAALDGTDDRDEADFSGAADQPASTDRPQTYALGAFRGSLDLLCEGAIARGVLPTEIAEILGTHAFSILEGDHPLAAEIFARAAERLPAPRDLAA